MERLFDKLIGYVRAIEVAGIDVVDTEASNLAQDRDRTVVVCWRPEYMWTSQLHGPVPHASKDQIIGELERASWQCCRRDRLRDGFHVRVCHRKPRRWRCNATFIRNSCLILQSTGLLCIHGGHPVILGCKLSQMLNVRIDPSAPPTEQEAVAASGPSSVMGMSWMQPDESRASRGLSLHRRSQSREWRMLGRRGRRKREMDWLIRFASTSRVLP